MLNRLLEERGMTKYRLAKDSGISYSTVRDICNGTKTMENCSGKTLYKISKVLRVTMESLVEPYIEERCDFEAFKSNVCHRLKDLGDIAFIKDVIQRNSIRKYFDRKWYPESLYLLAMLDYISRLNGIERCKEYDDLRKAKLSDIVWPIGILLDADICNDESIKEKAYEDAIPEFKRFNIVENEVRNVI